MCVAVGVLAVLIDTQIRLVLQRVHTIQGTTSGSLLMALIEIVMRISKLGYVKFEVHHRKKTVRSRSITTSVAVVPSEVDTAAMADSDRWKRNAWKLYMTEVYADMVAEYIAVGCSTLMLFFYKTHPKYQLSEAAAETPSTLDQLTMLTIQVAIEMVVDFLAYTLEIRHGMDFRELRKHGVFILTFFVLLAIINIQISAAIYLRT